MWNILTTHSFRAIFKVLLLISYSSVLVKTLGWEVCPSSLRSRYFTHSAHNCANMRRVCKLLSEKQEFVCSVAQVFIIPLLWRDPRMTIKEQRECIKYVFVQWYICRWILFHWSCPEVRGKTKECSLLFCIVFRSDLGFNRDSPACRWLSAVREHRFSESVD